MKLEYLRACSPYLIPIEEAFLCLVVWIRENRDDGRSGLDLDDFDSTIHAYFLIWKAILQQSRPGRPKAGTQLFKTSLSPRGLMEKLLSSPRSLMKTLRRPCAH